MSTRIRARRWRSQAAAASACLVLAACTTAGGAGPDGVAATPESEASIRVTAEGAREWSPNRPIVVTAKLGTLTSVTIRDEEGRKLPGRFSDHKQRWASNAAPLPFDTRYTVEARAVDAEGLATRTRTTLRTVKPKNLAYTGISPIGASTVGVGMPIIVTFDQPVTRKQVAERRLKVTTAPQQVGGWYWVNDQMVRWRPKTFWRPGTDVSVRTQLAGVELGKGVWGDDNDLARFTVGDALISTVDIGEHTMTVTRNGDVIRTVPITTGKSGWDTRIGTKVIISKQREVVMDAATIDVDENDPEYYRLDVEYAMRLTWSGEYLHAAPWSVESQGEANVSHGCTGMSNENASWFYNMSKPGDVVKYVNGTRTMEPWNGYTDWNMSWAEWQQGSALS